MASTTIAASRDLSEIKVGMGQGSVKSGTFEWLSHKSVLPHSQTSGLLLFDIHIIE